MYSKKKERNRKYSISSIVKLVNELCYMLQSGVLDIFSSKRKRKKGKEEKKEKKGLLRDISERCVLVGLTFCYIVKKKEKGKRSF